MTFATTARLAGRPFGPRDVSGLVGWWESETISGADGDPIGTWGDATSTRDFTSSGSERPVLKVGVTPSGRNALRFDGSDDNMAATVLADKSFSMFAVCKITGGDGARVFLYNGSTAANGFGGYSTTAKFKYLAGGAGERDYGDVNTDWHVFSFSANNSNGNMAIDDVFGVSATPGSLVTPGTRLALMGESTGNSAAGDVAAVLLYEDNLSLAEFTQVHDWLYTKYLAA
jgi:hypothetical protein